MKFVLPAPQQFELGQIKDVEATWPYSSGGYTADEHHNSFQVLQKNGRKKLFKKM